MIAETNFVLFSCISGLLLMQLWKILIATTMRDDFIHIYVWRTFVLLLHFPVMTQQTCQANMSGSSLGFGQKCTFAQCQWNRAEDRNQGDSSKAHDRLPWLKRNAFSVTAPTRQTWSFCSALLGYKYMQNCSFNSRISKQTCNIKSEVFLYNRVLITVSSSLRHRRLSKKSRVRQPQQMQHLPVHSLTRCKNKHCWLQWSIDPLCSCIRELRKSC